MVRRQVSLDGVSGDVLDAMVEEPITAGGLHAPARGTPAAGAKKARKPGKGKGRAVFGSSSDQLEPLQLDSVGIPQQPTLLPQLTPVSPDVLPAEGPFCRSAGCSRQGNGKLLQIVPSSCKMHPALALHPGACIVLQALGRLS